MILAACGFELSEYGEANEQTPTILAIKQAVSNQIESAIKNGYTHFATTVRPGFNLWFAEAVVAARQRYPDKNIFLYQYTYDEDIISSFENNIEKSRLLDVKNHLTAFVVVKSNNADEGRYLQEKEACENAKYVLTSCKINKGNENTLKYLSEIKGTKKIINISPTGKTLLV